VLAALVLNVVNAEMLKFRALHRQVGRRAERLGREGRPQDVVVRGAERRCVPDGYLLLAMAKLRVIVLDL
jgi:hypothetical protein